MGWLDGADSLFAHPIADPFEMVVRWSIELDIAYQATKHPIASAACCWSPTSLGSLSKEARLLLHTVVSSTRLRSCVR